MAIDLEAAFKTALTAGVTAAKPGGKMAEDWIRECADANKGTYFAISKGVLAGSISEETAAMLWRENDRAIQSEAAALRVIMKATAQAAINAFLKSLGDTLGAALKLAL